MKVTEEEMELLKGLLNGSRLEWGIRAVRLIGLWRNRGVKSSEFQLLTEEKFPLGSSSPPSSSPPLDSPSLSPRSSPSTSPLKEGAREDKKLKLTSDLILASVPIDLTLRSSPSFLVAWKLWVECRLKIKPLPTLPAFEQHMNVCARLGSKLAIREIENAIAGGWRRIFEPPQNKKQIDRDRVGGSL